MLRPTPPDQQARLRYLTHDFIVERQGSYVLCAVTGARIDLEQLRYWSAELQEAYASGEASTRRHEELKSKS